MYEVHKKVWFSIIYFSLKNNFKRHYLDADDSFKIHLNEIFNFELDWEYDNH